MSHLALASSDYFRQWIPLGDDFQGRFRILYFRQSSVAFWLFHTFSRCTSYPAVTSVSALPDDVTIMFSFTALCLSDGGYTLMCQSTEAGVDALCSCSACSSSLSDGGDASDLFIDRGR